MPAAVGALDILINLICNTLCSTQMAGLGGKLGRELDKFRQQQLQASSQLEKPKKPKKEAANAAAKAAPAAPQPVSVRRHRLTRRVGRQSRCSAAGGSEERRLPTGYAVFTEPDPSRTQRQHGIVPCPLAVAHPPLVSQASRPGPSIAYLLRQAVKALQAAARPLSAEEARPSRLHLHFPPRPCPRMHRAEFIIARGLAAPHSPSPSATVLPTDASGLPTFFTQFIAPAERGVRAGGRTLAPPRCPRGAQAAGQGQIRRGPLLLPGSLSRCSATTR